MASIAPSNPSSQTSSGNGANYRGAFTIMTSLFFLWGFATSINDILIPKFRETFTLSYTQAMFVQLAFFGAYFIGSLAYFLISAASGDPIAKIGYKNGVVTGLLIAATGCALFWPAANTISPTGSYGMFLAGLFIIGLGLALLQIAANPYVTILGPEKTASSRLNLAQAFNSVGTTTGPLIGGWCILKYFNHVGEQGAASVKIPFMVVCLMFLTLAVVFFFIKLPHVGEGNTEPGAGALKYPHVVLGFLAIFMYVGGEVSVGSAIVNFLGQPNVAGMTPLDASKYVSLFWGGMLIGRFMGAVQLSEMKMVNKQIVLLVIPVVCFLLFWVLRSWDGDLHAFDFTAGWTIVKNYLPMIALCWVMFQIGQGLAGRTLVIFSLTIVALLLAAIFKGGTVAMWCVVGVGLFTSIGWPNIFSLALDGMGVLKSQVSSLLVMGVVGGAVLPPLLGKIADLKSLQFAFIVPMIAYGYVAFYGAIGHKIGRKNFPAQ
jgi:FHS family L-fucose permease-like MFS transporter